MSGTCELGNRIRLLVPEGALPGEGAEVEGRWEGGVSASDLLEVYAGVAGESPLAFGVSGEGAVRLVETSPVEEFVYMEVGVDGGGEVGFSWGEGGESELIAVDLGAAAEVEGEEDADGGLRRLVGNLVAGMGSVVPRGRGVPVPLVRWHREGDEGGGIVQLLGVWLAEEEQLVAFGEDPGGQRILFEDGDVEGHGLREAMAMLGVVGVMLAGAGDAEAGFLFFKSKVEKEANRVAKVEAPKHRGQAPAVVARDVVAKARATEVRVIVDVSKQRAYLVGADGGILIDTPVSTARTGKYTPRGEFQITQRVRTGKTSTIYGCALPYWMRLGESAIGLHVGELPGYPASAGCVRLPAEVAPVLFEATKSGTTVTVVNSWQRDGGLIAGR